ncbi:uncharacterized protein [Spinacia oleracea]|uniref:CCHC-type domain-containing protein n=1 Tax=Spinacia oleracea TaxID=3562 RepID=A0ABM3RQ41_SPIOL|nr:uncharacterized protein LOC130471562 [Spinacia oleracea]
MSQRLLILTGVLEDEVVPSDVAELGSLLFLCGEEESKDIDTLSIEELLGSLQVHEQRIMKNDGLAMIEQALESKLTLNEQRGIQRRGDFRGRGRGRGNYQPRNYNNEKKIGRGRGSNRGGRIFNERGKTKDIQCYNCQKYGHYASDCWRKQKDQGNRLNFVESSQNNKDVPTLLLAHEEASNQQDMWFFDSRASNHMCGRKELFIDLDEKIQGNSNILSIGQLLEKGYIVHMEDNNLLLKDKGGDDKPISGR